MVGRVDAARPGRQGRVRSERPGLPAGDAVQREGGPHVHPRVEELLRTRHADAVEELLPRLVVDGEDAVAAVVARRGDELRLPLGDGQRLLLEVVWPDLADDGLDLGRRVGLGRRWGRGGSGRGWRGRRLRCRGGGSGLGLGRRGRRRRLRSGRRRLLLRGRGRGAFFFGAAVAGGAAALAAAGAAACTTGAGVATGAGAAVGGAAGTVVGAGVTGAAVTATVVVGSGSSAALVRITWSASSPSRTLATGSRTRNASSIRPIRFTNGLSFTGARRALPRVGRSDIGPCLAVVVTQMQRRE